MSECEECECGCCREELSSAQEEFVKVCGEKDRLETAHRKKMEQVYTPIQYFTGRCLLDQVYVLC